LRGGAIFYCRLTTNLLLSLSVKKFEKWVSIWQSYWQKYSCTFFQRRCSYSPML